MAILLLLVFAFAGSYNIWVAFGGAVFSVWHLLGGVFLLLVPFAALILSALYLWNARYLNRTLSDLSEPEVGALYRALEDITDGPAVVFRLGRTGLVSKQDDMHIPIIGSDALNPWAGRQVTLKTGLDKLYSAQFEPCQDPKFAHLHGEKYALVAIPRITTRSGKAQNKFQYDYYLQKSRNLKKLINQYFPNSKPERVLEFLFETYGKNGDFLGFGGCFIGGYPRWIQEPDFPECPVCRRRMHHLLEIGSNKAAWNRRVGQSYFFSCKAHPLELQIVTQWD